MFKYSESVYQNALPEMDPFWNRYELRDECDTHQGNIGLCTIVESKTEGVGDPSIKPKPLLIDNTIIDGGNHIYWFNKWLCVPLKNNLANEYPWLINWDVTEAKFDTKKPNWDAYILNFDSKCSNKETQQITQNWLLNKNRNEIFSKWNGKHLQNTCICHALSELPIITSSSVFFHFRLINDNGMTHVTNIDNYNSQCNFILCLRFKFQRQQRRRHGEIDYYNINLDSKGRRLVGALAYLMNQIIETILESVNQAQKSIYPFHWGTLNDCVCFVFSCFCARIYILYFFVCAQQHRLKYILIKQLLVIILQLLKKIFLFMNVMNQHHG